MILKIPMTGTVKDFSPEEYDSDNIGIKGDDSDPVRIIDINLGGVSWRLVSVDLENDLMEVEVEAPEQVDIVELDSNGNKIRNSDDSLKSHKKTLTPAEKEQLLINAQYLIESHTKDELYAATNSARLKKPAAVMTKYRAYMRK